MKLLRLSLALSTVLLVPACGGGGGGSGSGANVAGPKNLNYPQDVIVLLNGVEVTGLVPSVNGNVGNWSIAPSLPSGVSLNGNSGAIVGTPTALSDPATYTITASNAGGSVETEIELGVARPAGFLVAANEDDDTLSSYAIDPVSGQLVAQGYVDSSANGPEGVWRHPSLDVFYVPHRGPQTGRLEVFILNPSTGTPIPLASRALEDGPHHLAISADGLNLYVVGRDAATLQTFALDPATGIPTLLGASLPTGDAPNRVALDPQGRFAFVGNTGNNDISIYALDDVTGAPTAAGPDFQLNGAVPGGLACSNSGEHLFVTAQNFDLLLSLLVDPVTGDLSVVNAVPTGDGPVDVAVHPDGRSLVLVQSTDQTLQSYPVEPATGVVGPGAAVVSTGAGPAQVTYDEAGILAYVANADSNDISVFKVLPGAGTLSDGGEFRARQAPSGVAVFAGDAPLETVADNLYALNAGDATLSSFTIDAGTGQLTPLAAPISLPTNPVSISMDPQRRFAFACLNANSVLWTIVLAADGTPSVPVAPLPSIVNPTDSVVGPNGKYLYVTGEGNGEVASYLINPTTGELTFNQVLSVTSQPSSIAIDPTGRFLAVADSGGGRLLSIEVADGAFVGPVLDVPAGGGPMNPRFSADGRFLWVALRFSNLVIPFEVDAQTGGLTALPPGAATGTLTEPVVIEPHPSGRFAYAALHVGSGFGSVVSYSTNEATGALAETQRLDIGLGPIDLVVDPTGSFAYVLNEDGDDLTVFSIGGNGGLSEASVALTGDQPIDLVLTRRLQ